MVVLPHGYPFRLTWIAFSWPHLTWVCWCGLPGEHLVLTVIWLGCSLALLMERASGISLGIPDMGETAGSLAATQESSFGHRESIQLLLMNTGKRESIWLFPRCSSRGENGWTCF